MTDTVDHRPSLHDSWREACARVDAEEAGRLTPTPPPPPPRALAADANGRTLRHDGWTPERQRRFLATIAAGTTIEGACRHVGLSVASAYALRAHAAGAAFALGWAAANLLAREPIADGLLARALDGQVEWYTRADGERAERFRYDNGLATRMLARLDRQAEVGGPAQQAAARVIAGEFEAYLDLLGRDEGPARAGLFLAARTEGDASDELAPVRALARADRFARAGGGMAGEVDATDLDLAARATWTAEQWTRAEAAGLLRVAPEPAPESAPGEPQLPQLVTTDQPVWWDEDVEDWRTNFPPPADFDGDYDGSFGDADYQRELDENEWMVVQRDYKRAQAADRVAAEANRDRWFADAAGEAEPAREPGDSASPLSEALVERQLEPLFDWPASDGETASDEHVTTPAIDTPEDQVDDGLKLDGREPRSAPSLREGGWADLEGENRPDRQHDGRDRQDTAG